MAGAGVSVDLSYALTPFLAWFVAGVLKFTINSVKAGRLTFGLIGYGGLPSNHSCIVSSMAALIAFKEGITHPAFGIALTLAFIVMLDASSLRRHIGKQAAIINELTAAAEEHQPLRERMGHTPIEIGAGIVVGVAIAGFVNTFSN
jgi:acid phosphatase family membrane protein YuiD